MTRATYHPWTIRSLQTRSGRNHDTVDDFHNYPEARSARSSSPSTTASGRARRPVAARVASPVRLWTALGVGPKLQGRGGRRHERRPHRASTDRAVVVDVVRWLE